MRLIYVLASIAFVGLLACDDGSTRVVNNDGGDDTRLSDKLREAVPDSALRAAINASLERFGGYPDTSLLDSVTQLAASGRGISDLTGIGLLTSLEFADLWDNRVSDITPLGDLRRLQVVDLSRNMVTDVSALSELPALSVVILDLNPIRDLSPLLRLEAIEEVSAVAVASVDAGTLRALQERGVRVYPDPDSIQDTDQDSTDSQSETLIDLDWLSIRAVTSVGAGTWLVAGQHVAGDTVRPAIGISTDDGVTWSALPDTDLVAEGIEGIRHISVAIDGADTTYFIYSRIGWRRSLDAGRTWPITSGLPQNYGLYIPVVFSEITMESSGGRLGWMTTLPGPKLYQTSDGGSTWQSFADRVFDHGFDAGRQRLVYTNGNSLFLSRPPWTEKQAVVQDGDWRLIAAEFVSEEHVVVADTNGLYRVDLATGSSTRVLEGEGDKWLACRIRHSQNDASVVYAVVGSRLREDFQLSIDADPFMEMERTLWRSLDYGATWEKQVEDAPIDVATDGYGTTLFLTDAGIRLLR